MIEVSVTNNTTKKVSEKEIEVKLRKFLETHNISDNSEVSVLLVGKDEMLGYVERYLHETGEEAASHPVLSFVQSEMEGTFTFPPDNVTHLGEIVASVDHAKDENELYELIKHGALHLLGHHHD